MAGIRDLLRNIIYVLLVLIISLLFLRFVLDLFGFAGQVPAYFKATDFLLSPYRNAFGRSKLFGVNIEAVTIFAMFNYALFSIVLDQLLTFLFHNSLRVIVVEFFIAVFEFLEYFFFSRIIVLIFAAGGVSPFTDLVYEITNPAVMPLNKILPIVSVMGAKIEIAAILVFIGVIVLDYIVETVLVNLLFGATGYKSNRIVYRMQKVIYTE